MDNVIKTKPVSINIKVLIMRFLMKSYRRGVSLIYITNMITHTQLH